MEDLPEYMAVTYDQECRATASECSPPCMCAECRLHREQERKRRLRWLHQLDREYFAKKGLT